MEALDAAKRLLGEARVGRVRYRHVVVFDVGALRLSMLGPRVRALLQALIGLGSDFYPEVGARGGGGGRERRRTARLSHEGLAPWLRPLRWDSGSVEGVPIPRGSFARRANGSGFGRDLVFRFVVMMDQKETAAVHATLSHATVRCA
jgi:hypothetical protein